MNVIDLQIFNLIYVLNQLGPVQVDSEILCIPFVHLHSNLILHVGHIDMLDHLFLWRSYKCLLLIKECSWIFEGDTVYSRLVIKEPRRRFVCQEQLTFYFWLSSLLLDFFKWAFLIINTIVIDDFFSDFIINLSPEDVRERNVEDDVVIEGLIFKVIFDLLLFCPISVILVIILLNDVLDSQIMVTIQN